MDEWKCETQLVHQSAFFSATSQEFRGISEVLGLTASYYYQRNCDFFFLPPGEIQKVPAVKVG